MFWRMNTACWFHFRNINLLTGLCKSTCVCLLSSPLPPLSSPLSSPLSRCPLLSPLPSLLLCTSYHLDKLLFNPRIDWNNSKPAMELYGIDTKSMVAALTLTVFLGILDASCHAGMIIIGGLAWERSQQITRHLIVYIFPSSCSPTILIFRSNRLIATPSLIGNTVGGGHGAPHWLRRWASDNLEPSRVVASCSQYNTFLGRLSRL